MLRYFHVVDSFRRFTSKLATMAGQVTAVDFMEQYIEKNRTDNGHFNNVTFKCADVTK